MKQERYYQSIEDLGLQLEYCGVEFCEPDFAMPTHSRESFLLHYVFRGRGSFYSQEQFYQLQSGSLFAIFPQEYTRYNADPQDPLCFCWVGFSGSNAMRLVERAGFNKLHPVGNIGKESEIKSITERCMLLIDSSSINRELEMQSLLYKYFSILEDSHNHNGTESHPTPIVQRHVLKAKNYIYFNYMNPMTIEEIACQIGLERTYFSKIFKQLEGVSPQMFLQNYRIGLSKRLLTETSYNIKDIASLVGIHDAYYFSKAFKATVGMPPTDFRRSYS